MHTRPDLGAALLGCVTAILLVTTSCDARDAPNVILVLADDLGYGDIGGNIIATPSLDRMAREGVRLSNFYASANVCTPSRAGLLTGRYPIRSGLAYQVIEPQDKHGLPDGELTVAEMLGEAGYRTALIGKWHLGHTPEHWPTRQGFDTFFGLPYSNDMEPLALYRNEEAIEEPVEQETLTERYTEEAISIIASEDPRPFFIFLAHTFPHIPLHVSEAFAGRSRAGLYGDAVETIDWSMGQIMRVLRTQGIEGNTLVIFTSDNGAWFEGDNGAARAGKGTTWEGGYHVPLLAWWPGQIPAGRESRALTMNIDLLPTIAGLSPGSLPDALVVDGQDIWPALQGSDSSPHAMLYFFDNEDIAAVRTPRWKLLVHSYYRRNLAAFARFEQGLGFPYWLLFDMDAQRSERYSMARENPQILDAMLGYLGRGQQEFGPLRTRPVPTTVP